MSPPTSATPPGIPQTRMSNPSADPPDGREGEVPPDDLRKEMSEAQDRARALAAVLRDQAEREEAAQHAEALRLRHTRIRRAVLAVAWVGMAYVWFGSPSWLKVAPPPQPTLKDETQALRVDIFLQPQMIEAYRKARGRLPYVLPESGPPFPVMRYHRGLMMAILHDKVQIADAVNGNVISLDDAPQGYADFDGGAAKKYVLDPHGMIAH